MIYWSNDHGGLRCVSFRMIRPSSACMVKGMILFTNGKRNDALYSIYSRAYVIMHTLSLSNVDSSESMHN